MGRVYTKGRLVVPNGVDVTAESGQAVSKQISSSLSTTTIDEAVANRKKPPKERHWVIGLCARSSPEQFETRASNRFRE